jgi:hypothetical protein
MPASTRSTNASIEAALPQLAAIYRHILEQLLPAADV